MWSIQRHFLYRLELTANVTTDVKSHFIILVEATTDVTSGRHNFLFKIFFCGIFWLFSTWLYIATDVE